MQSHRAHRFRRGVGVVASEVAGVDAHTDYTPVQSAEVQHTTVRLTRAERVVAAALVT